MLRLRIVFIAGIALASAPSMMTAERPSFTNSLRDAGVDDLTASDEGFTAAVDAMIGAEARKSLVGVLPSCVVVTNRTGRYLAGLSVLYRYPTLSVPGRRALRRRVSAFSLSSDTKTMMEPGAKRFICPVYGIQATANANGEPTAWPVFTVQLQRAVQSWQASYRELPVEIWLDAIVYENGTLVGWDEGELLPELQARVQAETDLTAEIGGFNGEALTQYLKRVADAPPRRPSPYGKWKSQFADVLLGRIGSEGQEAAVSFSKERARTRIRHYRKENAAAAQQGVDASGSPRASACPDPGGMLAQASCTPGGNSCNQEIFSPGYTQSSLSCQCQAECLSVVPGRILEASVTAVWGYPKPCRTPIYGKAKGTILANGVTASVNLSNGAYGDQGSFCDAALDYQNVPLALGGC